mgnify:CR=1 FL=1
MKIYTKKGDRGQTSLLGGTRVQKHHIRIEAYGTVDELNSHIGLIRDQKIGSSYKNVLLKIQDDLFTIGSMLACDPEKLKIKIPEITADDVTLLENKIDEYMASLPEIRSFVLPGGHTNVSFTHIARCVCRRAERAVTKLAETNQTPQIIVQYLNRLSDYLFTLARKLTADFAAEEVPWRPRQ